MRLSPPPWKSPPLPATCSSPSSTGARNPIAQAIRQRRTAARLVSNRASTTNISTAAMIRAHSLSAAMWFTAPGTLSRQAARKAANAPSVIVRRVAPTARRCASSHTTAMTMNSAARPVAAGPEETACGALVTVLANFALVGRAAVASIVLRRARTVRTNHSKR